MIFIIRKCAYFALLLFQITKSASASASTVAPGLYSYPIINSCVKLQSKDYVEAFDQLVSHVKRMAKTGDYNIAVLWTAWRSIYSIQSTLPDDLTPAIKATDIALKDIFIEHRAKYTVFKIGEQDRMRRSLSTFVRHGKIDYCWHPSEPKQLPFCMALMISRLRMLQSKQDASDSSDKQSSDQSSAPKDGSVEAYKKEIPKMLLIISDIVHFRQFLNRHVDRLGIKWGLRPLLKETDALTESLMNDMDDPITSSNYQLWIQERNLFEKYLKKIKKSSELQSDPDLRAFLKQFAFFLENP